MISAFKTLFSTAKRKKTASESGAEPSPEPAQEPTPAAVEDYVDWRAAHPHDAELLAGEFPRARSTRCHVHDVNLVTVVGFRSRMDSLPSGDFMDAAMENPFCLDVGEGLKPRARHDRARLIFCEACEAGMKARLG